LSGLLPLGYVPFEREATDLLFQLISQAMNVAASR